MSKSEESIWQSWGFPESWNITEGKYYGYARDTLKMITKIRHRQYAILFLTLVVYSGIHASLSVAIVTMTGEAASAPGVSTHLEWTNPDQILSAFFWAYFIPLISGSKLSQFYRPKWLLLTSVLIGSVFNIGLPTMAKVYGATGVIICRAMQGLSLGYIYPCINRLIDAWTPTSQRDKIWSIVYGGVTVGTAICMPLAGSLAASASGWPVVFYVYGVLGIFWAGVFAAFIENSPSEHSSITEEERRYVEETIDDEEKKIVTVPTPWISIFKSPHVWAILVAAGAHSYGTSILLTQMPTYLNNIMNFDINEDGDLSSIPYWTQFVVGLITGPLTNKLLNLNTISTTNMRKILTSLGLFLPAIFLMVLAFLDGSEKDAALASLIIAIGTSVCAHSGYFVNAIDLAPNHTGSLHTLVNITTMIFAILGPLTVGFLGSDKKDPYLWRNVFLITAAVYTAGGLFYDYFASGEKQPWNWEDDEEPSFISKIRWCLSKLYEQVVELFS